MSVFLGVAAAQVPAATDTFEQAPSGVLPGRWRAEITGQGLGKWTVESDNSRAGSSNVLKQSAAVARPSYPLCVRESPVIADGWVEAKFKTLSGEIDQAAGLVWRYQDPANYYVCRANARENNVVLYKVSQGKRTAIDIVGRVGGYGVEKKVEPARWQTLRVEFKGDRFRVFFQGELLFEVTDQTFAGPGKLGVWTKADSVTLFDDFSYSAFEP